jgi:hypothetical protein
LELIATYPFSGYEGDLVLMGEKLFVFANKPSPEHGNKLARFAQLIEFNEDGAFNLIDEAIFGGWDARAADGILFASTYTGHGYALAALDFAIPNDLRSLGFYDIGPYVNLTLSRGVGSRVEGFWFPVGAYGVLHVPMPDSVRVP